MALVDHETWQAIRDFNDRAWATRQDELQQKLGSRPLGEALRYLWLLHLENGFIEDDLSEVRHFSCADQTGQRRFLAQFNPRRARRAAVGRAGLCVLDVGELRRQQRGLQHFHRLTLNARPYHALPNPCPFAPFHTSIASQQHEPQAWWEPGPNHPCEKIERIVQDLLELASQLPGWVILYNGAGAGATVDHLHFHALQLFDGQHPLPIQVSAEPAPSASPASTVRFGGDGRYPITAFQITGSREEVVTQTVAHLAEWTRLARQAATANLIALGEGGQLCLYLIPRNRFLEFAAGFPDRIGSMEVCGVFICSREEQLQDLQQGRIDFARFWNVLQAVHPRAAGLLSVQAPLKGGVQCLAA